MRLGLIADVHCCEETMREVVAELSETTDEILLAGDALYEYRFSNGVIELIRDHGVRFITGNHERVLLGPHGERARSAPHVRRANLRLLQEAPDHLDVVIDGKRLMMFHGSPWAPHDEYVYANSAVLDRVPALGADYIILGHTHVPMTVSTGSTLVINPGSLEASRERGHAGTASYAVLDTTTGDVELVRRARAGTADHSVSPTSAGPSSP